MFVMKEDELKRQIIGLLSSIVVPSFEEVEIIYNKDLIERVNANFGTTINRGSVGQIFILYQESAKMKDLQN